MSNVKATLKINVNDIDKKRLYKGEKGTYLNCVLIETPNSQYSDYMIVESISKEEREAGNKGTIIGEGKKIGAKPFPPLATNEEMTDDGPGINDAPVVDDDGLPF
jgi:hypothetical protein